MDPSHSLLHSLLHSMSDLAIIISSLSIRKYFGNFSSLCWSLCSRMGALAGVVVVVHELRVAVLLSMSWRGRRDETSIVRPRTGLTAVFQDVRIQSGWELEQSSHHPFHNFFSTGHVRPEKSEPSGNAPLVYRGQWFYMCIIGPKRSQDGCLRIQTLFDTRELSLTMATRSSREHSKTEAISNGPCCLGCSRELVTTCKCLMHRVL